MLIEKVSAASFPDALDVYIASWRESHRSMCSADFLEKRDYAGYLQKKIDALYLIYDKEAVGVFSLKDEFFSDLYIHPDQQGKGYGTFCLRYAMNKSDRLRLMVLSNNDSAIGLYEKMGFRFTGLDISRKGGLTEREMVYIKEKAM